MLSVLVCRHVVDRLIVMLLCYDHYYYSYYIHNKNIFPNTQIVIALHPVRMLSLLVCRQQAGSTETGRDRELWGRAIVRIEIRTFS